MKHFSCTTTEIISWLRLCRPGSVIGPQQNFLQEMEKRMHREGDAFRKQHGMGGAPAAAGSSEGLGMEGLSVASSNGSRDGRTAAAKSPALLTWGRR